MRWTATIWLERLALSLCCMTLVWGPLAQGSTFGWGMSGLTVLGCLTLVFTVVAFSCRGRMQLANPWWVGAITAFLAWVWLSTVWAVDHWEALRWAGVWTAVLGTSFSVHVLASSRRRQTIILTTMVLTGAAAIAIAYLQMRSIFLPGFEHYPNTGPELVTGPYYNPSHFSGFLISVTALLTGLLLFTRLHFHTLPLLIILVVLHTLNLKTDSSSIPGVLLATGIPILIFFWQKVRKYNRIPLIILSLVTLSILSSVYLPQINIQEVTRASTLQLGLKTSWGTFIKQRKAVWDYGYSMWHQHPINGVGIGQFSVESPRFRKVERAIQSGIDSKNVNYAHNEYLQIASELGIVGVILWIFALALTLIKHNEIRIRYIWISILVSLGLTSIYDSHMSAIMGTSIFVFCLAGLQRQIEAVNDGFEVDSGRSGSNKGGR